MTVILAVKEAIVEYNRPARQWEVYSDTHTREEALVVGDLCPFPAGSEGKQEAQLEALRRDCPQVADDVEAIIANNQNHPQVEAITRRAIKAGFLVRDGQVLPPRSIQEAGSYLHEIARVRSQSEPDTEYAVCLTPERQSYCECVDWHNGHLLDILADYYRKHPGDPHRPHSGAPKFPNGDYGCKHILAVRIAANQTMQELRLMQAEVIERMVDELVYGPDY